jgi:hypothetical protein
MPSIDPIHAPIKIHVQSIGFLLDLDLFWKFNAKTGSGKKYRGDSILRLWSV